LRERHGQIKGDRVMTMRLLAPALLLAATLAGCDRPAPVAQAPLAGARIGGPFTLVDQHGRTVDDKAFAGRWRIMYFGYTFCPDVCPTDAQNIGAGLKLFEQSDAARAGKVVPIFVTVDPARDTPAVLAQFVAAFHPRMVGLTGAPAAIEQVKREYGVFSAKGEDSAGGGYLVNHSRQTYLMDPAGKPIMLVPTDQGPKAVAAALEQWVR
jgi:protein SCO1/2